MLFRCAESTVVADVSSFGEQVVGFRVGQGAVWRAARRVCVLDVIENLCDESGVGDLSDDAKPATAQWAPCDVDIKDPF